MIHLSDPKELQHGKRLAAALAALLFAGLCGVLLLLPALVLVEYAWEGSDALERILSDWTRPSPYVTDVRFKLCIGIAALGAVGVPMAIWYRLFVTSGYVPANTQEDLEKGRLPVVGGYWKPFMYTAFIGLGAWGTFLGFKQDELAGAVFFGLGSIWFALRAILELKTWIGGRGRKPPQ